VLTALCSALQQLLVAEQRGQAVVVAVGPFGTVEGPSCASAGAASMADSTMGKSNLCQAIAMSAQVSRIAIGDGSARRL